MTDHPGPFFIGFGNPARHDDGVGPWIVRTLAARGFDTVHAQSCETSMIEILDTHSDVVIFDATQSGQAPGTITQIDAADGPVPMELFRHSNAQFAAGEAVETARTLGCLPPKLILFGIEGKDFTPGNGLTPQVEWAAWRLLERFLTA